LGPYTSIFGAIAAPTRRAIFDLWSNAIAQRAILPADSGEPSRHIAVHKDVEEGRGWSASGEHGAAGCWL
jgi:hypothetical protein